MLPLSKPLFTGTAKATPTLRAERISKAFKVAAVEKRDMV